MLWSPGIAWNSFWGIIPNYLFEFEIFNINRFVGLFHEVILDVIIHRLPIQLGWDRLVSVMTSVLLIIV